MDSNNLNIKFNENQMGENSLTNSWELLRELLENSHAAKIEIEGLSKLIRIKNSHITDLEDKISEMEIKLSVYREKANIQKEKMPEKDLESINSKLDKLHELFSIMNDARQKTDYEADLIKKDEKIAQLESQINSNNNVIKDQNSKISTLETTVKKLNKKINTLEKAEKKTRIYSPYGMNEIKMHVPGLEPFVPTLDDKIAGAGWIVIHRRINGKVSFDRTMVEYCDGFGNFGTNEELWLGLERIHKITAHQQHELYVHYVDYSNETHKAKYDNFVVGSKDEKYVIKSLGSYTGDTCDMLRISVNMAFWKCDKFKNAWWDLRGSSPQCNLTGSYCDSSKNDSRFLYWGYGPGGKGFNNIKSVQMLIRPITCSK